MKIPPVKGTRDFYPAQMARRNWIIDTWKAVSARNGFEEYDGPIFEYLRMFQLKSGQQIAEQLFTLEDRGGRALAIRPEITPTLARMVNHKINSLPRPVRWFSVPRLCRAERPQKGRLREFFQWNVDIIGISDELADAEVIFCAVDYLRQAGLTAGDVVVRISSRAMMAELLCSTGLQAGSHESVYAVLDKKDKVPPEAFSEMLLEAVPEADARRRIARLMEIESLDKIGDCVELSDSAQRCVQGLRKLFGLLDVMDIGDFCRFDIGIVRGLAYYTGIVFEIYDRAGLYRAIGGGGRYDDLLGVFGGPSVPATGFGMGDCVLGELLEEKGLFESRMPSARPDFFVAAASEQHKDRAVAIAATLRRAGLCALFSHKTAGLAKQIKEASQCRAVRCAIIGDELSDGRLVVKDMATGRQQTVDLAEFLRHPHVSADD